jgi:hypothetical protein
MKLLGRSIDGKRLVEEVRARLTARGIHEEVPDAPLDDEAPVEPHAFLVQALEENADPVKPPPAGPSSRPIRTLARLAARGLLEELFGRQRVFNLHVRDLAAQLSTEVLSLRARVRELETQASARSATDSGQVPSKRLTPRSRVRPPKPRRR